MATTKRKTTTKKRATKATSAKKRTVSKQKQSDFWTVKFTVETLYWLIFGVLVVAIGYWTFTTSQEVNEIYDNMNDEELIVIQAPQTKTTE
ncbi:hypothetical protein KC939_00215 [Candidatus Saccharibacteria bacterium]|nr:hypothetical protein [Candidatus Saccharibacteria bacterium]